MKKSFGVLLVFVVMVLTACGTTVVPEIVAANAELEVQIITSESDSTPVNRLEIRDSEGKLVFSELDLVNRIHKFELGLGETYTVSTMVKFGDRVNSIRYGETTYERKVKMVAVEQRVVLDLRNRLSLQEDTYLSTPEELLIYLGFPSEIDDLELVVGEFISSGFSPLLNVDGIMLGEWGILTKVSGGAGSGQEKITFRRDPDRNPTLWGGREPTYHSFQLVFENSASVCNYMSFRLGGVRFVWENENSRMVQKLDLNKSCKG